MNSFKIEVKNNGDYHSKPRIYFTCHPDDFKAHFGNICADIFENTRHDNVAIYYTEDMSAPIEHRDVELGKMSIFVVPVTAKLLLDTDEAVNRAMLSDIRFAKEAEKLVLPIVVEDISSATLEKIYSSPERFGNIQRLDRTCETKNISYEKKLGDFLEEHLPSDKELEKVRDAFLSSIFLSYRKKDFVLADKLMRRIHAIEGLRDVEIWYDEFLPLGENWHSNIIKEIERCNLFTLLVTPSILESVTTDGITNKNFVIREECPMANELKKPFLSAEMVSTDHSQLDEEDRYIPEFLNVDSEQFDKVLKDMLSGTDRMEIDDPYHDYLIGLAYFYGIHVETDQHRAIECLLDSANFGCPDAVRMLYRIGAALVDTGNYQTAKGILLTALTNCVHLPENEVEDMSLWIRVKLDTVRIREQKYRLEAWETEELEDHLGKCINAEKFSQAMALSAVMGEMYMKLGDYDASHNYFSLVHEIVMEYMPERQYDDEDIAALHSDAVALSKGGYHDDALEVKKSLYEVLSDKYKTEDNVAVAREIASIAATLEESGKHAEALKYNRKALAILEPKLPEANSTVITTRSNAVVNIVEMYLGKEANLIPEGIALAEKNRKAYKNNRNVPFDEPMLSSHRALALMYYASDKYETALKVAEEAYGAAVANGLEQHSEGIGITIILGHLYAMKDYTEKGVKLIESAYQHAMMLENPQTRDILIADSKKQLKECYTILIKKYNKAAKAKAAARIKEKLAKL